MMTPTENRHTMTSPASTIELRRARAQAAGGFARRMRALAGVALVCALALGAEGDVASDNNTLANGASARAQEVAREDAGAGFLYSRWIEGRSISLPPGKGSRVGNYELTPLPQPLPGGKGEGNGFWSDVAGKVREGTTQRLRGSLLGVLPKPEELRAILVKYGNGEEFDMAQWREIRKQQLKAAIENAPLAFYADTEQSLASAISQTAVDRLGFVRRARVDFRTSLGDRQASGGVDAAGALRESEDEVIGWQLRAFAGESGKRGGNIGAFWRRAQWLHFVDEGLLGANIFADYEDTDNGGFWRWSIGGEMKTRVGDVNVNRYFVITDPVVLANNRRVYSRAGLDIDAALNIPGAEWAKARVGYFLWEGEFGDADIEGFKAGFDFKPGAGVVVGIEFDGESGDIGGNFSYTHNLGEPFASAQSAGTFDPRAHFFDAVRREYSQRIVNTGAGVSGAVIVGAGMEFIVKGEVRLQGVTTTSSIQAVTIANTTTAAINYGFELTGNVTVSTTMTTGNPELTMRHSNGDWHLTLDTETEVAFRDAASILAVNNGSGHFERVNGTMPGTIDFNGPRIILLGTRFRFDVPANVDANNNKVKVTLYDGGLGMSAAVTSSVTVDIADRARVEIYTMDSDNNPMTMTVGCATGMREAVPGFATNCGGIDGAIDFAPITMDDVVLSVVGGRSVIFVPFGATATIGRFSLSVRSVNMLSAEVQAQGYTLAAVTTGGNAVYDLVLLESEANVAGAKNPQVVITDSSGLITPITARFAAMVAERLTVGAPAGALVTQNIFAASIVSASGGGGVPPYLLSVVGGQESHFDIEGGVLNNTATRIPATGTRNVIIEATDLLGSKASVTVAVTVAETPQLILGELGLFVAVTNAGYSFAGQLLASGGVPPLQYGIRAGTSGPYSETANIANIGMVTVNTQSGEVRVQSSSVGATFALHYEVRDPVGAMTAGVVTVSVSEGVALSGPMLGATLTATTNGGANTEQSLGTVRAQLRPGVGVQGFQVIEGGSHVNLRAGSDSTRREVYYIGNTREVTTALIRIRVTDNSPQSDRPIPNMATASFHLAIVNPANVEAGLSGDINLRYFVGEESAVLTATASGGAGGNVFRISSGSGARVGNDGVLHYRGGSTSHVTVTVFADDNHSGTDATPAVTVTLSALARLRAESITQPQITTGSTLSGANANVATVSVSGGENRAQFAYSRINEGTQLTGADINNEGVIFAADNNTRRIDAEDIGGTAGNRNFVYQVIDGAREERRQTLRATLTFNSIVPQPIAADVQPVGNNVITVGADAMARLRITPRGGGGAYNFAQENADNIMMAAQADANNAAVFIVNINAPSAAGTASVSIVINDEHFATAPYTLARQFIAIDNLAVDFQTGADLNPITNTANITFAMITVRGGLNPQQADIINRSGDAAGDLEIVDRSADNRSFALRIVNNANGNLSERTITFAVRVRAANNDAVTLNSAVTIVERVKLLGGGRYTIFATDPNVATVVTFRPVGGTPHETNGYSNQRPINIGTYTGVAWLNSGGKTSYIARNGTDDTPGTFYEFISEVNDTMHTVRATATITVIASLSAAINFAGGALDTGVEMTVATLSAGGGVGDYAFSANNNAVRFVEGTIAVANFANVGTVSNIEIVADDNDSPITEPITFNIALTALRPLSAPVLELTVTTGSTPGAGGNVPALTIQPSGGHPPYAYWINQGGVSDVNTPGQISPPGFLYYAGVNTSVIQYWTQAARNNPGAEAQTDLLVVYDNSTPPRRFTMLAATVHYVLPPTVTGNVNQTISRYRKGASVTLATLSYSGGSGASGLTASVLGFYQANSQATVINNEVVVWPDPAVTQRGTARITVVTYDADNGTAPASTLTFAMYVVDALTFRSPPSEPLTVTTQGNQSGSAFNTNDALPRLLGVGGGNADNSYNLGSRTDGFDLGTQNQQFSYTGNSGRFAQDADTVLVTVFGMDRTAADNYRQTTSLTITVAFIDPQEDVTIGFAPGFDTSPLTAAGEITIGEVVVGGGLGAQDPTILGNSDAFRIEDSNSADTGRAFLILGGTNTTDRAATVTLSGDDDHTRTDAALVTVEVNVVDRVKLRGAGARYTVLAQADNAVTPIFSFEPIGGMPDADDGYSVQTAIEPTDANLPTGFTRTGTRTVAINRNAVSITTGEHVFIQRVADTANTVQGTATVLVINELALSVGDNSGGDAFRGDIILPGGFPFGQGFASGGAGDYTYQVLGTNITDGGRQDVRVQNDGVMIASHPTTHDAATLVYTLIANDTADATAPATVEFTLTVLPPVSAAPLPVILVTTKSTPGGAGAAGPPRTVTTKVEFFLSRPANPIFPNSGFNGTVRSLHSLIITAAPGVPVTVNNRNIGSQLQGEGSRNAEIRTTDNTGTYPVGNTNVQIPNAIGTYTLYPYPALTGGGGGGGTVPAFTIDASGGQPMLSYHLNNNQTPGALADILYYTADSANDGVIYFNAGVQARANAGDVEVAHNLQVRDSSSPTRNASVPGMLTIRYVLPPPVTVAVNQTVNAYKTGVSVTIAELTYTGGASDNLAATVLGVGGGTDDITVQVSGGDVLVSAAAAGTGAITATINAYDAGNDTAENDTTILTVEFVPPLVINNIPAETLTVTTRGSQPAAPTDGFALPREMTASGGNGGYGYDLEGVVAETILTINNSGILSNRGVVYNGTDATIEAVIVATDAARNGYSQTARATISIAYIHPPALSMGFVESPAAAALTTANNITIGTIALTGGLTDLSIVIAGHADFALSLIESSPATAALILSGNNNANERARTVAVTITGNDNHLETTAQLLSITVRINDALTLISAPPGITITAGKIDGFTGVDGMTAILANLNVQGNLSDDITVSIIDAAADNLPDSLGNLLSLTGATANWTLDITSSSVAQTHIGTPYNLAFEIRDGAMSVVTVTIPVSVVNAPVRADTAVSNITTYFYTGLTSEVTLTAITFTNLYIPANENASFTINVAPATGDNATASEKYTAALSAITNAAGAVEIKYTRPTAPVPLTDDSFTLNATVIISNAADNSKNPFTATATLQWKIGGIPALSINFQSPPNTVFIRGYKGTIGVLTVTAN